MCYGLKTLGGLSKDLGRSISSVRSKTVSMGLHTPNDIRRKWSGAEIAYIESNYERLGSLRVAKKLKRTVHSVQKKAQDLGVSIYFGDVLTGKAIARYFSCDYSVVKRWMNGFGLKHQVIEVGKVKRYQVKPTDFWKWAETHVSLIRWDKYEQGSILPEPDWVARAIKEYGQPNYRQPIKDSERVGMMRDYVVNQSSLRDISEKYKRTVDSVKHILCERKTQDLYCKTFGGVSC